MTHGRVGAAPELEGGWGLGQCGAQTGGLAGRMELELLGALWNREDERSASTPQEMGMQRLASWERRGIMRKVKLLKASRERVWKDSITGSFAGRRGVRFHGPSV